jgi:hypothetical protein
MPSVNPLVEGIAGRGPVAASAPVGGNPPPEEPTRSSAFPIGGGFGSFTHSDNTSTHVAVLVGIAFGVIAFFYWGGFKFAVDAGVTRP